MKCPTVHIAIKAISVIDNQNGTFTLELPGKELLPEQAKALDELFPDLSDAAYRLLSQQALIRSLATDAEASMEPVKKTKEVAKGGTVKTKASSEHSEALNPLWPNGDEKDQPGY